MYIIGNYTISLLRMLRKFKFNLYAIINAHNIDK